jgi:outer membrane protein assembly factor BamB
MRRLQFPLAWLMVIALFTASCSDNWPRFRGPDSNMVPGSKNLQQEWNDTENIQWKQPLAGNGWSSPIIWGEKVFYTASILDTSSIDRDTINDRQRVNPFHGTYRWMVYCLDLNTGEILWERIAREGKPRIHAHNDNTYASETPVTDGEKLIAYFGMMGMYCYDLEGKLLWDKDLGAFEMQGNWGASTSPVLYGKKIFQQMDNEEESFLVALDKETGEEAWRISREEKSNWSTPVIWQNRKRTELVTSGSKARSYNPEDGTLLWELDLDGGRNIPSPVPTKDLLFIGNEPRRGGGGILFAVKAGSEGDITPAEGDSTSSGVLWSRPEAGLAMSSPVLYGGHIYLVNRRGGGINCIDASTGRPVYSEKIPGAAAFWSSPWAYDGKIWCLDEDGTTHVIKAGGKFEVLATNRIGDKFWASAAFSQGACILRGVDYLYCIK